mmetsp:Transcript_35804/g.44397  ORF Transcript_35804/g.44397 Transcript_35804/m.44397 type:complete len:285 (-) Transcript_35804:128-982(-)|eukprot:CAMPEP_0204835230 /NCGR_PEP_ID=MMETSP1346-20131115/21949_1 /ASSEMBLY_ACC=CAM_ASM_000771 /TAXON_ID=215587 /ORGANISM="Aplanochytrium stocchinoi, Strain GSBS06" /LENGTH=284 /DNA_ID=CAMNT_0051969039 /DNA_START=107 /DNA_END=961 /DNA_ORIENTATION=+
MNEIWKLEETAEVFPHFCVEATTKFCVVKVVEAESGGDANSNILQHLQKRVAQLESKYPNDLLKLYQSIVSIRKQVESAEEKITKLRGISNEQERVTKACEKMGLKAYHFIETPSSYYSLPLEERAKLLGAPTVNHLCKSLIYKNTNWDPSVKGPQNSEYYCIILQYTHKLNNDRMSALVRNLNKTDKLSNNSYTFRFATPEESYDLSGFKFNAIAPVGMKKHIPIIVASPVLELVPPTVYLGGGLVDLKLKIENIAEFVKVSNAYVLNVSTPRGENDQDEFDM